MAKVKVGGARVKRGQDSIGTHLVIGVSFLSFSSLFFFLPSLLVGYFLFFFFYFFFNLKYSGPCQWLRKDLSDFHTGQS
jgi:hypothetical protein